MIYNFKSNKYNNSFKTVICTGFNGLRYHYKKKIYLQNKYNLLINKLLEVFAMFFNWAIAT